MQPHWPTQWVRETQFENYWFKRKWHAFSPKHHVFLDLASWYVVLCFIKRNNHALFSSLVTVIRGFCISNSSRKADMSCVSEPLGSGPSPVSRELIFTIRTVERPFQYGGPPTASSITESFRLLYQNKCRRESFCGSCFMSRRLSNYFV